MGLRVNTLPGYLIRGECCCCWWWWWFWWWLLPSRSHANEIGQGTPSRSTGLGLILGLDETEESKRHDSVADTV